MKCYIVIDKFVDVVGEVEIGGAFLDRNDAAEYIRSQWSENLVDDFIVETWLIPKKKEKKNES
jgi:hypothetical protein